LMTGLTSRLYALPDIQNECYLLTNCPYEVDTFRDVPPETGKL
jgi:hypothetical protein